mgnify:CR=1 FL=1
MCACLAFTLLASVSTVLNLLPHRNVHVMLCMWSLWLQNEEGIVTHYVGIQTDVSAAAAAGLLDTPGQMAEQQAAGAAHKHYNNSSAYQSPALRVTCTTGHQQQHYSSLALQGQPAADKHSTTHRRHSVMSAAANGLLCRIACKQRLRQQTHQQGPLP